MKTPQNTTLIVCETCGYDAQQPDATRKGELFARALENQLNDVAGLVLHRTRCLMACQRQCTALLRAEGKTGYILGGFSPDADSARALLDYCEKYVGTTDGSVPWQEWPEGVKGKFIARIPV